VTFESSLTNEVVGVVSGGAQTGGWRNHGIYAMSAALDTETAGLWEGGTAFIHLLQIYGNSPLEIVGDIMTTSNIEAPNQFLVHEAWYGHSFLDDKVSMLAGIQDFNSQFYLSEYGLNLLHSVFEFGNEFAQANPATYPVSGLGVVLMTKPTKNTYIYQGIYDGNPGSATDDAVPRFSLGGKDGVLLMSEVGFIAPEDEREKGYYKFALGYWHSSAVYTDVAGNEKSSSHGLYNIGERSLFTESDPAQGLGAFYQVGVTSESSFKMDRYYGLGFTYTGLLPCRDADLTSLGFAWGINGKKFRDSTEGAEYAEKVIELTHRTKINEWLSLQPDLQYVMNPGTDSTLDDALVVALRVQVAM
jgi:porin